MAIYWVGGASAVAQQQTFAFGGTWEVGDLIRATIGSKVWDYAVTDATIATFLPLFVTAFNALDADDYPEMAELTASSSSPTLTFTADTEGVPFTVTLTPLESDGSPADAQTIEGAGVATPGTTATASSGPEDWSTAKNWSGGAVPVDTDDVVIDRGEWSIKYGLSQTSVDLVSLRILVQDEGSFQIGLPEVNEDSTPYPEYRTRYLSLGTATAIEVRTISSFLRLDVGSTACTAQIHETGQGSNRSLPALLWKGTNAANVVNVQGNSDVGIAWQDTEVATVATLRLEGDCSVRCGSGTTLTTANVYGGSLETLGAVTTFTIRDGAVLHRAGAVTTLTLAGTGTMDYRSSGTVTTLTVGTSSSITFDNDPQGRTVSACDMWAGSSLSAENGTVTFTAGIDLNQCTLQDVDLRLPRHIRLTIGSPA